ncbi:UNVERIFIED_CONTAM: hypothetical protein GTU68_000294 [Idotea baltica]|nr:hypothetical protein [Idotea baltica]
MGPEVLRDISFQIAPRSFQFLTGPSGAGKTSLLRLLFLSMRPSRGLISIFGKDAVKIDNDELPEIRRRIGIVFQDFRLLDHMTTYENVALPLRVQGMDETRYRSDVVELLDWVGLGERMHVLPPILSGGEKQRAAIARALIGRPDILLADEPTGNVDPPLARRLLRLFIELNKLGTTVVIATHDLALIDQFDTRRFVLKDGRLQISDSYPPFGREVGKRPPLAPALRVAFARSLCARWLDGIRRCATTPIVPAAICRRTAAGCCIAIMGFLGLSTLAAVTWCLSRHYGKHVAVADRSEYAHDGVDIDFEIERAIRHY